MQIDVPVRILGASPTVSFPRVGAGVNRFLHSAQVAVAVPTMALCSLYGQGDASSDRQIAPGLEPAPLLSVGGGPPGGTDEGRGRATPTRYRGCGRGAIPEPGLQGQVPLAEQRSGASRAGYRCNMKLIGENDIEARGANFQLAWYRDCAYVGSVGTREMQALGGGDELDGVAVLDVGDPRRPQLETIVRSPVGVSQHEALEVNRKRGMLVVQTGGLFARWVEIYDVSRDCRNPVFKGRYDAGFYLLHGLRISDDGRTVYATDFTGIANALGGQAMHVLDVTDMTNPRLLMKWDPTQERPAQAFGIHDLELSRDGTRAYLGAVHPSGGVGELLGGRPSNRGPTMVVLDTTDIQKRRPNPDPEIISDVRLENFGHTEQRATIDGKPYIFTSGEAPFGGQWNCPWAWGNAVNMADERNPKVVSTIKLEVNEGENCANTGRDNATYSIHYSGVDSERETTTLFYTYYAGGVRAFDVRNPRKPREIAYYHPPPVPDTVHEPFTPDDGDYQGPTLDQATSNIRYRPGKRQLWVVSVGRGFQVVKLRSS